MTYDPIAAMERELEEQDRQYRYTLTHGYCRMCDHCRVCDWEESVGWCTMADEFVAPGDHPADYDCDCYEGVAA